MRKLLILASVAAITAACHNRNEDEVGAAPDQGRADTTAVTHQIDSTRTGPPGEAGRPGNATITPDSVGIDSTAVRQGAGDTTSMGQDTSLTSTPQDTLGPRNPGAGAIDTTGARSDTSGMTDTSGMSGMNHDTTGMSGDTTGMTGMPGASDTTASDTSTSR
jgi:hypothetical protein